MRTGVFLLFISLGMFGQDQPKKAGAPVPAKNLKVLSPEVNVLEVMRGFNTGLGVQCSYCHAQGDFASDDNPKKEMGRKMLLLIKQINMHFADAGNDFANSRYLPFPEGKQYVTCFTRHQGETRPKFQPPSPIKRAAEPYAPGQQGVGVPEAPPAPPGTAGAPAPVRR